MDYNADVITFVQTVAGWALTGDTSEQTMFILFGSGANGKSTFLNTIMYLLGDYAIATPTETFMRKNGDQNTNDIARLRGTRFVTTTEAEQGRRLSEPLIKQITGNDRMTARILYGEFFNFLPTFKIFMATNHKPVIKGTDHGIWRRIKLIPFTTRIPEEKQDKRLEDKLRAEASGILNWLLEGTRLWRREGLKAPAAILNATDEYRGEMDVIGNSIKEKRWGFLYASGNCSRRIRNGVRKTTNTLLVSASWVCASRRWALSAPGLLTPGTGRGLLCGRSDSFYPRAPLLGCMKKHGF
jgi:putative DNA primase/helicase